jgi:hypothetical protein
MRGGPIRTGLVGAALVLLMAGCGEPSSVGDAESRLSAGYRDVLSAAGITHVVDDTCHAHRSPSEAWTLYVTVRVDASPERVAELLEDEGMVVLSDREPMLIQQTAGDPVHGWNGTLIASGAGTVLGLAHNGVTAPKAGRSIGWLEVCQF